MKRRVTFNPQAWLNDHAINVDPQGNTVFHVSTDYLEKYDSTQLKYELEPYMDLPQLPAWIRNWNGPFWFEVDEAELVLLEHQSDGAYQYEDWSIQNPHLMSDADPDTNWYATNSDGEILGPFDTLQEVREYLTRYATIDDWRGDLCMALRDQGRGDLADEIGGISDQEAMTYRDTDESPHAAAKRILERALPLKYAVTISDTYTHLQVIEIEATTEAEARAKAERQYEDTYDAAQVFEAFAMNGAEGHHQATEVNELEPTT